MTTKPKKPVSDPLEARGKCATCAAWEKPTQPGDTAGTCRKGPPQVQVDEEGAAALWPYTDATDWCLAHTPVLQ